MDLTRFARVRLTHAPTPLEHLPRLSKLLGGPEIYLKRDDCTGLASGGNKTRKLEFLIGDALAEGATHIVQRTFVIDHVGRYGAHADIEQQRTGR